MRATHMVGSRAKGHSRIRSGQEPSMSQSARILIVDDEATIRLTLGALLKRAGYEVTSAENGHEEIYLLEQPRLDLMVVDLKMAEMDGMQVVAAARQRQSD